MSLRLEHLGLQHWCGKIWLPRSKLESKLATWHTCHIAPQKFVINWQTWCKGLSNGSLLYMLVVELGFFFHIEPSDSEECRQALPWNITLLAWTCMCRVADIDSLCGEHRVPAPVPMRARCQPDMRTSKAMCARKNIKMPKCGAYGCRWNTGSSCSIASSV
jgi:hypothetical protein